MQMIRIAIACACLTGTARAQQAGVTDGAAGDAAPLDIKLTLSSFLYRQVGSEAPPIVGEGAMIESASPVRRYFGDLRLELADDGLVFDGRIRQTTSARYQSGASGGAEYEIRTLAYRLGGPGTQLVLGRQFIDAVGSSKIDGAALVQRLSTTWSGTLFGGGFPALGSRSLDTDYPAIRNADGSEGSMLVPISAGLGIGYHTPGVHGSVGVAGIYVAQDVPEAPASERSRVFTTANGYARPASWLDIYHFASLDVAGGGGIGLTNGSLGLHLRPATSVQLSGSVHHVSTDLLQIAARNVLEDPDPEASGVVQNHVAIIRVSQDVARIGTSVALARSRFELSLSSGYHRRPAVEVSLVDGTTVAFPEARSADATITVLDRKSLAGLRVSASAALTFPLGNASPTRTRGTVLRLSAGRGLFEGRGELAADVMLARFRGTTDPAACTDSFDILACFSSATTSAAQAGVLGSYRVGREWMALLDLHAGAQDVESRSMMGPADYPRVLSLTIFGRVQWRYR